MKAIKYLSMLTFAMLVAITFTACSDDDDDSSRPSWIYGSWNMNAYIHTGGSVYKESGSAVFTSDGTVTLYGDEHSIWSLDGNTMTFVRNDDYSSYNGNAEKYTLTKTSNDEFTLTEIVEEGENYTEYRFIRAE